MTQLRWWTEKVGKQNVAARANGAYGIRDRVYVSNVSKAKALDVAQLAQIRDPYVRMSLRLQAELGLRRAESIKVVMKWADQGDRLVLKDSSITAEQAEALLRALPQHQRDVVLFALATGLRQSNAVGFEWSHGNLAAAHAWVGANQSKNGKPIAIPLNATALAVLRRQMSASIRRRCSRTLESRSVAPTRKHGETP